MKVGLIILAKTKNKHSMIVFISQEKKEQLLPLIENRPAALLQVAGKTLVEWFYEISKNHDVERVFLLADKNDRKLLGNYLLGPRNQTNHESKRNHRLHRGF